MGTSTLDEPYGVQASARGIQQSLYWVELGPSQIDLIGTGRAGRRIDAARSSMTCDARVQDCSTSNRATG